ncbi:hypothetical protein F4808DRAFT_409974 [Astrocystis sublimbata]|nr:hypothetical protein F4808DRAFT_409974 [Astrocystis sublimbata]
MNIPRIDGSRYGAVLVSQPLQAASSTNTPRAIRVPVQVYVRLHHGDDIFARSAATGLRSISTSRHQRPTPPPPPHRLHTAPLARLFCSAVASAGARLPNPNYFTSHPLYRRSWNHSVAAAEPIEDPKPSQNPVFPEARVVAQDKDEILNIVDYYDEDVAVDEYLKFYKDPYLRNYAPANGPHVTVSDRLEDVELQTVDGDPGFVDRDFEPAWHLWQALAARRRRPAHVPIDAVWELYQALPEPRPAHMSTRARCLLMSTLASGEKKDQRSMLRYFAVVADVKNAGFALTSFQWNWALSFASRYVAVTTEVEVEAALKLWRTMEKEANIKGTEVTFNILFDCASKAGKFTLAEMIYQEMTHRRHAFNRFHHVSLIHYFGLKLDSGGVRAAYKEMIDAGEMIDTVTCNCLIASFIRCGEEHSAEYVYARMKTFNKDAPVLPHIDYTMAKAINKVLQIFARVSKKDPSLRAQFQRSVLLSPDLHTYRILINHYGINLGDISKVVRFLDEMKAYMVQLNGVIFLALFKSFAVHGGPASDWSATRLNSVWNAFLNAIDTGAEGLYISTWMAMAALEAHSHYANRDQIVDIYDAMRDRWSLDEMSIQYMLHFLQTLLDRRYPQAHKPSWAGEAAAQKGLREP